MSEWKTFDELWEGYKPMLGQNCDTAFKVPNNTPEDTENIRKALLSQSKVGGVPSTFALALMMQESLGCVHVPTTANAVQNPGLFQAHDGNGTCYQKATCSADEITQMAHDGICGTVSGPGLEQLGKMAGSSGAETWYRAARLYNSGVNVPLENLNDGGTATNCYCMDIANRVVGNFFTGNTGCNTT